MDADWAIGADGTGTERFFDGLIDEAGIWGRALSAEEVAHLYESGLSGLTYGAARSQGDPLTIARTWTAVDGMQNATADVQVITIASPESDSDGDGLSALREYLEGTDPGLADSDGDGLTDLAELDTHGSDPLDADTDDDTLGDGLEINTLGTSPLLTDSDEDGLSDPDEYNTLGTDPAKWDTDGETLGDREELDTFGTDPLDTDSDDDGLLDAYLIEEKNGADTSYREIRHFTHAWQTVGTAITCQRSTGYYSLFYDFATTNTGMSRIALELSNYGANVPDGYRFRVGVSVDGTYIGTLEIAADLGVSGTGYIQTPWLTPGTHTVALRWMNDQSGGGRDANIMVEKVALYGIDGPDADSDGIQDWMEDILDDGADTDGDGLSDYDEITVHNTSPVFADSDGDGLSDAEELALGTNPAVADSDGDGVDDGTEANLAFTDPTAADFDGTQTVLQTLAGTAAGDRLGTWDADGTAIYARDRHGWLEYGLTVPSAGYYALAVDVTQRHPFTRQDRFDLYLELDGARSGRQVVTAPHGTVSTALFFLPELSAGTHTARLVWRNLDANTYLQVNELRLVDLGGADADGDGVKDWLEARLEALSLFDAPAVSLVSPVCLEGESAYAGLIAVEASYAPPGQSNQAISVEQGVEDGWYADILLSPTSSTAIAVTEMSGGISYTGTVIWAELDLFGAEEPPMIREDDSLLLNAVGGGVGTGTVDVVLGGATLTSLVVTAGSPLPYRFESAGDYTLEAAYTDESGSVATSRAVRVIGGAFAGDPACIVGTTRTWDCPDLPHEAVIEYDTRLTVTGTAVEEGGWSFSLLNGDDDAYRMLARLGENGPVLDSATVTGIAGTHDLQWRQITVYDDGSRLVEVTLRLGYVPPDLEIYLNIFVGGVLFDDGTLTRVITAADFDELGRYTYRIIQAASSHTSVCHRTKIYQNGQYIGGN